ncbi:hypothetical protein POM88_010034 [Heracleum sosnowskyi]|uniref:Uncharacterized protein n=1 Tax=Heracleum sosnowskyi TaxID=360622 RepID=A0AAD8N901_9APIA|nr:hypothetical protein POM88_010034 [Heracleum sosnowskyi]
MFKRYRAKAKEVMDYSSDDEDDVTDISDDEGDIEADRETNDEGEADAVEEEVESDGEGSDGEGSHEGSAVIQKQVVTYNGHEVHNLNELEYRDDEVWANVWQTDCIARISPKDGVVRQWILLQSLRTKLPTRENKTEATRFSSIFLATPTNRSRKDFEGA